MVYKTYTKHIQYLLELASPPQVAGTTIVTRTLLSVTRRGQYKAFFAKRQKSLPNSTLKVLVDTKCYSFCVTFSMSKFTVSRCVDMPLNSRFQSRPSFPTTKYPALTQSIHIPSSCKVCCTLFSSFKKARPQPHNYTIKTSNA